MYLNTLLEDLDLKNHKEQKLQKMLDDFKDLKNQELKFSQFVSNFEQLENILKEKNISLYKITGATNKSQRYMIVDKFNTDDTNVMLISLKAGGTGLNIVGADTVIHYDPWWNMAVENQATDRAHRMGQKNKFLVLEMICKNTIEEKIVKIQEEKRTLANDILYGEEVQLSKMNKEYF